MIIQTSSNIISLSVSPVYTQQLIGGIFYNSTGVVGILNGTTIYQLSNGLLYFVNGSNKVLLPSIFTPSIVNSIFPQISTYYLLNEGAIGTASQAVYIDSSKNVYLGYNNGTYVIGLKFLSNSTNINTQGIIGINVSASSTSSVWYDKLDISFYAQLTNPTVTYTLATNNSGGTASGYIVLDGVASTTSNTTSTTPQTFTYQYSVTDTQINLHKISLWMVNSVGSDTTTMQFISLY